MKKNSYIFVSVLLLNSVMIQSMDVTESYMPDGPRTIVISLKEYNAFVNSLENEKYQINEDKWHKLSLNGLIGLAAEHSDNRYVKKLMEYPIYAHFITSKGLALYENNVTNDQVDNIELLLDSGADVNAVVRNNKTLLWHAVSQTVLCSGSQCKNEVDKVIELLIKRGANVAIEFDKEHPTLLHYVEDQIAGHQNSDSLLKIKELLRNASKIRDYYLKKQTPCEQQNLENIADHVLNVNGKDFKMHSPILSVRCASLLNF